MDSIGEAVERAVNECIAEGILKEFLTSNKAERREAMRSIFEMPSSDLPSTEGRERFLR